MTTEADLTHYGRIRAAIEAAERKRAGSDQYGVKITVMVLPQVSDAINEIAKDRKWSRSQVVRDAIEEYAKDFRFRRK